jgi:hypothetical protein
VAGPPGWIVTFSVRRSAGARRADSGGNHGLQPCLPFEEVKRDALRTWGITSRPGRFNRAARRGHRHRRGFGKSFECHPHAERCCARKQGGVSHNALIFYFRFLRYLTADALTPPFEVKADMYPHKVSIAGSDELS